MNKVFQTVGITDLSTSTQSLMKINHNLTPNRSQPTKQSLKNLLNIGSIMKRRAKENRNGNEPQIARVLND